MKIKDKMHREIALEAINWANQLRNVRWECGEYLADQRSFVLYALGDGQIMPLYHSYGALVFHDLIAFDLIRFFGQVSFTVVFAEENELKVVLLYQDATPFQVTCRALCRYLEETEQ